MSVGDWLVIMMGVLYMAAAAAYGFSCEWAKLVYFVGATILTVGILMMKG